MYNFLYKLRGKIFVKLIFLQLISDKNMLINGLHACVECGNMYKSRSTLMRHKKFECGKDAQFKCQNCDYASKHKSHVTRHFKTIHMKIKRNT